MPCAFGRRRRCPLVIERRQPDLYRELEVAPTASAETIKAAYTALAKRYHPDRNAEPGAGERMQRINDAYAVLSVPFRRRNYDLQRFKAPDPPAEPGASPADGGRVTAPRRPGRPRPLVTTTIWRRTAADVRRRPALAIAVAAVAGCALLACVYVLGAITSKPAGRARPTAPAFAPGVRVIATAPPAMAPVAAANMPVAPTPALAPSVAAPAAPTVASALPAVPTPRAADTVFAAARRFADVEHLTEAAGRPPGADRAWAYQVNGCTVYAGEYDQPDRADAARRYWSQQSARYVYQSAGPVVAAVGDCDTPQRQFQVLDAIGEALTHPR